MDDWPTHQAELTRKTSDALADLAHRLEEGEITAEAAFIAAGIMWDCTAGLIDRELMELIVQARAGFKGAMKK